MTLERTDHELPLAALFGGHAGFGVEEKFNDDVAEELHRLRVRAEARRQLERAEGGRAARPPIVGLRDFLAAPDDHTDYLIEGVLPTGARAILSAQYKAGKTTAVLNAISSLVDRHPFLGQFQVTRPARVVLIDDELDSRMLRRWLAQQGINNVDAVRVVALRGSVGTFDIIDPKRREEWADEIRGADVVVLDCLRPILDALGLDENRDAGKFLVAFDSLLSEAGASEALIVHHMGHTGERSRGDSRLLDWPDVSWKLIREHPDDPSSARYFSAFGRDVNVPETRLAFDDVSRRLSVAGGSRKETRAGALVDNLVQLLRSQPGLSQNDIEKRMVGHDAKSVRTAVSMAVDQQKIRKEPRRGRGGGFAYYPPS